MTYKILTGDMLEVLPTLEADSIDSIVCDPPYGLSSGPTKYLGDEEAKGGFMGKNWDHGVPGPNFWVEALRVAKPGAFLVAFGGTRTYHRLTCAIEDAGWEIRDSILAWGYAQGFPKSTNVSKMLDRAAGAEREVIGLKSSRGRTAGVHGGGQIVGRDEPITAPATDMAKRYKGWGSALKPAWESIILATKPLPAEEERLEPIILARKPLIGTIAANVLKYGTGGINIDGCRIGTDTAGWGGKGRSGQSATAGASRGGEAGGYNYTDGEARPVTGRWPANLLLLDEEAAAELDAQSGTLDARQDGSVRSGGPSRFFATFSPDSPCLDVLPPGAPSADPTVAGIVSGASPEIGASINSSSTGGSGSKPTAPLPTGERSTTSTSTPPTTRLTTSLASQSSGMTSITPDNGKTTASSMGEKSGVVNGAESGGRSTCSLADAPAPTRATASLAEPRTFASGEPETASTTTPITASCGEKRRPDSRFFYCAKAGRKERDAGLEGFALTASTQAKGNGLDRVCRTCGVAQMRAQECRCEEKDWIVPAKSANNHPTVKPIAVMAWLCRLVTPPGGTVLDPFTGSGSTGCAAVSEGFNFVGVEKEPEYAAIAEARIAHWAKGRDPARTSVKRADKRTREQTDGQADEQTDEQTETPRMKDGPDRATDNLPKDNADAGQIGLEL